MFGLIEGWLFNYLGINCSLAKLEENNIFQDGCILTSIFHKYGIINDSFNKCIQPATTTEECRKNLKLLMPVFEMLKIRYDENIVNEIIKNNAGTIINLLYELYTCIENKQHLYFIKKETFEKVHHSTTKGLNSYTVNKIEQLENSPSEKNCLEQPLIDNAHVIEWYKNKYEKIKTSLEAKRDHLKIPAFNKEEVKINVKETYKTCPSKNRPTKNFESVEALPELDSFFNDNSDKKLLDYETFVARYKSKQNTKKMKDCFNNKIQHGLLQKTWSKIEEKENKIYNSVFSEVLLKQSHYEKQLLSKLIQTQKETCIQNQNNIFAKHSIVNEHENIINKVSESNSNVELIERMFKYEQNRVIELHRKLYKEKKERVTSDIYNICQDVVDDLLELVFSVIEYKYDNGIDVFECLWHNWMQLFIKSQPIYVHKFNNDIDYDEAINLLKENYEPMTENDVAEYLMAQGKWSYSDICLENEDGLNENNLAFIVYRLLTMKYPLPPSPSAADLPPFKIAGVLLNLHSTDAVEKLKILLSKPRIHVFDIDTAIKYCIKQFEVENAPVIEEKPKGLHEDLKTLELEGGKRRNYNEKKPKKLCKKSEIVLNGKGQQLTDLINKETQTVIEDECEEKTKRTTLGLLGEEVRSILKEGGKIKDSILASVITEYLKSLGEFDGWLLLNYPTKIEQAYHLELALSGKKIPMENFGPEEGDTFHVEELDDCGDKRISRLLKCPISETNSQSFLSYFKIILRIQDEVREKTIPVFSLESYSLESNEIKENLSADFLKDFYCNLNIFKEFYSKFFDLSSLKMLARVILNENDNVAQSSTDLFGQEVLYKMTKDEKINKTENKSVMESKKTKKNKESESKDQFRDILKKLSDQNEDNLNIADQENQLNPDIAQNTQKLDDLENLGYFPHHTRNQNDQIWNFVSLPLNNEFGMMLATMWEDIESCYISNLHDILFENSFLNLRLHPYRVYVQGEIKNIANKQDLKQNVITLFQEYYNNINNELRALPEMKYQLHLRVAELQKNLSEIVEQRKNEMETKRQEIIHDNWLVNELCMLTNNYTYFFHVEFERSVKTLQLVNDYYINMLGRIPSTVEIPLDKQHIGRISVEEVKKTCKRLSNKSEHNEIQNGVDTDCYSCIIQDFVNCCEEELPTDIIYSILLEKMSHVKSNFSSILHMYLEHNKAEFNYIPNYNKGESKIKSSTKKEKTSLKPKKEMGRHDKLSTKSKQLSQPDTGEKFSEKELLIDEWKATINVESERLNYRLNLIYRRGKENIFEFYSYIKTLFCSIHDSILSSCNIETAKINLICSYLKTAIEEESPLRHPLFMGQDKFHVVIEDNETKSEDYMLHELTEEYHDYIFTMKQLEFLLDIFKISGPMGIIRKQPLCYILQDLISRDTCDNRPHLPKIWRFLNDVQLRNVVDNMFGLEFGVDWRDFIIYNLDIPYPNVKDILYLRNQFLSCDLDETELISLEDYENITLWFENELPSSPKQCLRFALAKKLLSEVFKVDSKYVNYTALLLYFCKDVNPEDGLKKALSLSLGKNVVISKSELDMIIENEAEVNQIVRSVLEDLINGIVETNETVYEHVLELLDSLLDRSQLSEEFTEESLRSTIFSSLKTESLKPLRNYSSIITLPPVPSPSPVIDEEMPSKINLPKSLIREKSWVSKIPVSLVLSVLNATLFYQDRRFALKYQYLNCIEDSADSDGMIDACNLVNMDCIKNLFNLTNKFKISMPRDILKHFLNDVKGQDDSQPRFELHNLHSW